MLPRWLRRRGSPEPLNLLRPAFVYPEGDVISMRSKLALLGLVLAAGLSVAACDIKAGEGGGFSLGIAKGKAEDTWTRTYKLAPGGTLELINVNGRIDAEASSGDSVELVGKRTAEGTSDEAAKALLEKVEMREEVGDSRVRVEVRFPRMSGFSGHQVRWTVRVPKGVRVDLRTVNGGVKLTGLQDDIMAKTTNGGVTGTGILSQSVEASAVNGGVEIEFGAPLSADAKVSLETVNGGVGIGIPSESRATISARAVNGGVRVSDLDIHKDEQSSDFESKRRLQGTMNGGGARVNLNTVNGGVRISRTGTTTS